MTTTPPHSHLTRTPHKEPPAHAPNAALLIDFDNVTMGIRSDLQTELKRLLQSEIIRGKVAVQRAYADWRRYPQYIVPLSESSIDLIFAPAYGSSKKNATDIRLAIDALELVFTRPEIGTFILLSGDSDFSSLVLKLKEYGKYVIGVGIRESSSDLLIQNCDEYFSYSELAGLTKTSDVQYERRDPWQLVIEAVKQMAAHNDVMRSDRLKQVMQELDPNFDEKDAGFSRFSKFVVEAAKRGLITLDRLGNGQYEVGLGPEAGGAPRATPAAPREPSRPRPDAPAATSKRGGFSLAEAFGLLRQAFARVGGADAVPAEDLREAMVELKGESSESLSAARFPRLLRQAHDAEIIDLSKEEDGGYQVRLRAAAGPSTTDETDQTDVEERQPLTSAPPRSEPPPAARRSTRFRRGSRGRPPATPTGPPVGSAPAGDARPAVEPIPAQVDPRDERARARDDARSVRGRGGGRGPGRDARRGAEDAAAGARRGAERPPRGDRAPEGRERGGGENGEGPRRRRRGGRGRGGRGPAAADQSPAGEPGGGPSAAPATSPPPSAPPAPESQPEGGSFWSRVRRGLIGGE
jgi:uncharacterized protein (TIGR00288 family)